MPMAEWKKKNLSGMCMRKKMKMAGSCEVKRGSIKEIDRWSVSRANQSCFKWEMVKKRNANRFVISFNRCSVLVVKKGRIFRNGVRCRLLLLVRHGYLFAGCWCRWVHQSRGDTMVSVFYLFLICIDHRNCVIQSRERTDRDGFVS